MPMIRSMTGFGRAQGRAGPREVAVELRSVNGRYLDAKLRLPPALQPVEKALLSRLRERLSRGRVECQITETILSEEAADVAINWPLARRYHKLFSELATTLDLESGPTLDLLVRQRDVLTTPPPPDPQELAAPVLAILDRAIDELVASREREGADLVADFKARVGSIRTHLEQVKQARPESAEKMRERLQARLVELGEKLDLDPQRFAQEVAYLADRADVAEEIVRLESHLDKFGELLGTEGPVGRKLDFLVQEFNREANTIGSKVGSASIQHVVVEIKSEIERIREQVQNIE